MHGNYTVYAKKLKYNKLTFIPRCCWIDVKFGHVDHSTQGTCTLNTFVKTLAFYNAIRYCKMFVYEKLPSAFLYGDPLRNFWKFVGWSNSLSFKKQYIFWIITYKIFIKSQ